MKKILSIALIIVLASSLLSVAVPALAAGEVKLFGADDIASAGIFPGNYLGMDLWTSSVNGTVTEIKVKAVASGNIKLAIYNDDGSGEPWNQLDAINASRPVAAGWNTIVFPGVAVTAGSNYWIAYITDFPCLGAETSSGKTMRISSTFNGFAFPNSAPSGFTIGTGYSLCAAWGTISITPPTVINSPSGASNITATSATLNGILTVADGATSAHIYWGSADGGTDPAAWSHDENLSIKPFGSFSRNITGLIPGESYYYRCYAINSNGDAWAANTSSFLAHNAVKLIGADDQQSTDPLPGNNLIFDRWTLPAGATDVIATQIRIKSLNSANINVALYSDNGGAPDALLVAAENTVSVIPGWNIINLPITPIQADTNYWIAYITDIASVLKITNYAETSEKYFSVPFQDFLFPGTANYALSSADNQYSLTAVWGKATTSAPVVSNAAIGASEITGTTALLNGVLDSTGGTATTVHVYWGTSDGGENPAAWNHDQNIGTQNPGWFSIPVSGLISGTTYYYRCSATNVNNTVLANTTSSFFACDAVKILGADDQTGGSLHPGNTLVLDRWTMAAGGMSGINAQIRFKGGNDGSMKVALYADNNGEPGTLLNAVNTPIPVSNLSIDSDEWKIINFPNTTISAGTSYWIAFITDIDCVESVVNYSLTGQRSRSVSYADFTFPATAGTGFTSQTNNYSLTAVWGMPVYTAPVVNSASGATSITDVSARLNGNLTSTGGKETSVTMHWGTTNGGTNAAAWSNSVNLGSKTLDAFYTDITGLTKDQTYYYTCSASNSVGTTWSSPASSFVARYAVVTPLENTTAIALNAPVQVKFNQPVTAMNLSGITISPDPGSVSTLLTSDGINININHGNFVNGTIYTVNIPTGTIRNSDSSGNPRITWSFTTIMAAPNPTVTPASNTTGVALDVLVKGVFNQTLTAIDLAGVAISPNPGGVSTTLASDGITLNIAHNNLLNGTTYTVTIPANTVKNSDNIGNASIVWSFTSIMNAPTGTLTPVSGSKGIALDAILRVLFNQTVTANNLTAITISPDPGGVSASIASDGMTLNVAHSNLANGVSYTINIPANAVKNTDGVGNAQISWSFTSIITAPTATITPAANATGVAANAIIQAKFNQTVTAGNLAGINITPNPGSVSAALSVDGITLNITHSSFASNTTYTVTIPSDAVKNGDGIGNALISWSFTSTSVAPAATTSPTANAKGTALDAVIQSKFDQVVTANNIVGVSIAPNPGGVAASLASDGMNLNIAHSNFVNGTTYTVTIPVDTVKNSNGTGNAEIIWSFTTIMTAPTATLTPAANATGVAVNAMVQAKFNQTVAAANLAGITIAPNPGSVSALLASDGVTLNIAHGNFASNTTYTVTIPADAVKNTDNVGNTLISWSFASVATPQADARGLKTNTISKLNNVRTGDKNTDNKIDIAIKNITDSLNPKLWVDGTHLVFRTFNNGLDELTKRFSKTGKTCEDDEIDNENGNILSAPGTSSGITVFQKEKVAVEILKDTGNDNNHDGNNDHQGNDSGNQDRDKGDNSKTNNSGHNNDNESRQDNGKRDNNQDDKNTQVKVVNTLPVFSEVTDDLVQADKILAQVAITDAKNATITNKTQAKIVAFEIGNAEKEFNQALQYDVNGNHAQAITCFGHAWQHAELAMKFAVMSK